MKIIHTSNIENLKEENNELYKMIEAVPSPSSRFNLTTSQKYWWYWFGSQIVKTNEFAKLDQIHLQSAAYWLDIRNNIIKLTNKLNNEDTNGLMPGVVQTFKTGANNVTAYVSIVEKADKALNRISEHFGLSLRDRMKLTSPKDVDPGQMNLFEDFLNQKTM